MYSAVEALPSESEDIKREGTFATRQSCCVPERSLDPQVRTSGDGRPFVMPMFGDVLKCSQCAFDPGCPPLFQRWPTSVERFKVHHGDTEKTKEF